MLPSEKNKRRVGTRPEEHRLRQATLRGDNNVMNAIGNATDLDTSGPKPVRLFYVCNRRSVGVAARGPVFAVHTQPGCPSPLDSYVQVAVTEVISSKRDNLRAHTDAPHDRWPGRRAGKEKRKKVEEQTRWNELGEGGSRPLSVTHLSCGQWRGGMLGWLGWLGWPRERWEQ